MPVGRFHGEWGGSVFPSSLAVDARTAWVEVHGLRYIALQRVQPSGKILSTVTRVSRCVKILRQETILTELFFHLSHHHRTAYVAIFVPFSRVTLRLAIRVSIRVTIRVTIRVSIRPTTHFVSLRCPLCANFFLSSFFIYFRYIVYLYSFIQRQHRKTSFAPKFPSTATTLVDFPVIQGRTSRGLIVGLNSGNSLRAIVVPFCRLVRPFNDLRNASRRLLRIERLSRMP